MCLKIKTGPFHSPAETTDINNSSDLVFLQKWKNQAFSRFFHLIKNQTMSLAENAKNERGFGYIFASALF